MFISSFVIFKSMRLKIIINLYVRKYFMGMGFGFFDLIFKLMFFKIIFKNKYKIWEVLFIIYLNVLLLDN